MSIKLFVVFVAVSAVLLATQTASCKHVEVEQADELVIKNPDYDFPVIVNDADLLGRMQDTRRCDPLQCSNRCRQLGFTTGFCHRGTCNCTR